MASKLDVLMRTAARRAELMTPAQREEQRRSFVYGNCKIDNDAITREMVDEVADAMAADK